MSSTEDDTHFCRLNLDDDSFYLLTKLKTNGTDGIALTLSDTESAWQGNLSRSDLTALSKRAKIEYEEFIEQSVKALTQKNVGASSFQYRIASKKDGKVTLHWMKVMSSDEVKIHLGDVTLKKQIDSSDILRTCFDHLLGSASKQAKSLHNLQVENDRLSAERTKAVKRLEKCVEAKEKLEEDLLSKFVEVLNTKKAKLRSLKHEVEELEADIPGTSQQSHITSAPKEEIEPETEEKCLESDYDTDEAVPTKKPVSIKALNLCTADSMLLESDPEEVPLAAVKRRKGPGRKPRKVASKPVVPRVSSTDKTATSLSKPKNIRKSTSSNRSLEEIDPNDLFDDMA